MITTTLAIAPKGGAAMQTLLLVTTQCWRIKVTIITRSTATAKKTPISNHQANATPPVY